MNEWNYMVDNEYTFYGVYCQFYDKVSRNWEADSTRAQNELTYVNKLIPNISDHDIMPISSYLRKDYDKAIERIILQGKGKETEPYQPYAESTIKSFRRLIYYVVDVAAKEGLCENVLWDSCYNPKVSTENEERIAKNGLLPRSLTFSQEKAVARYLLSDPMQTGQKMGFLLMYALGLRNAEACAVDFDDLKIMQEHPECTVIWIYKTTGYDNSTTKLGGKTKNADRIIPVPTLVVDLINERRKQLEELLGTDVGKIPIACLDDHWEKRCSARHLTTAARKMFQSINMNPAQLSMIDDDLHNTPTADISVLEAEPTAYILRRNFATHAHTLQMTETEIQYVLGHDVESPYTTRNEHVDEEVLYGIYIKMSQRPLLNDVSEQQNIFLADTGNTEQIRCNVSIRLPISSCKIKLHLHANEPMDKIKLSIRTHPRKMNTKCESDMFQTDLITANKSIDIRRQYHSIYQNSK